MCFYVNSKHRFWTGWYRTCCLYRGLDRIIDVVTRAIFRRTKLWKYRCFACIDSINSLSSQYVHGWSVSLDTLLGCRPILRRLIYVATMRKLYGCTFVFALVLQRSSMFTSTTGRRRRCSRRSHRHRVVTDRFLRRNWAATLHIRSDKNINPALAQCNNFYTTSTRDSVTK